MLRRGGGDRYTVVVMCDVVMVCHDEDVVIVHAVRGK
jgi:hypothetical protein